MFHRCYGVAQHRSRRCALNAINVRVWRRRVLILPKLFDRFCWNFETAILPYCWIHMQSTGILVIQVSQPSSMSRFVELKGSYVSEWLDGIDFTCRFWSSQVSSLLNSEQFLQMIVPDIIMQRILLWNNHLKLSLSKVCTWKNWGRNELAFPLTNSPRQAENYKMASPGKGLLHEHLKAINCSFMVFSSISLIACWYSVFVIEA